MTRADWIFLLLLAGCGDDGTPGVDAGRVDAGAIRTDGGRPDAGPAVADSGLDAGTDAGLADAGRPDAGAPDAGAPDAGGPDAGEFDAGAPIDEWGPLSPDLADCLGLTEPACAGCHLRAGVWYLRPRGVPPPPPDTPVPPWEECGVAPP
jgi:hypothetical protein